MVVQLGLCQTWSKTPDDKFSHGVAHLMIFIAKIPVTQATNSHVLTNRNPFEPRYEKTGLVYAKTKTQICFAETAKLISGFVFAT